MWRLTNYYIFVFSAFLFVSVDAQRGLECLTDRDCRDPQQWCSFGYCRCFNELQFEKLCVNEANYSEPCLIDEQCQGLLCLEDAEDKQYKCLCDRFQDYNFTSKECFHKFTLEEMLTMIPIQHDHEAEIENAANKVFGFIIASALLVIFCSIICTVAVIIFCCYMTYSDRKAENWIKKAELKIEQNKNKPKTKTTENEDVDEDVDVEAATSSQSAVFMEPIIMTQPVPAVF